MIVGRHIPISSGALPRFLERFETALSNLGRADSIIAAATAHHRLLWMHPFLDGNGRVARLMSYSMLNDALDTGGIWSVSRGLARGVKAYKVHLANCDLPRRNDLDGRGNLSEEKLAEFSIFFLKTCIDQIEFMESLVQPQKLRMRILKWVEEEIKLGNLPKKSGVILEAILYRGEVARSDVSSILNTGDRNARRVTSALLKQGVITATGAKSPLKLAFPASLASSWMPGLFPDQ